MPPYTIGQLAPLRLFELLAIYLRAVLPGKNTRQKYTIELAAAAASRDQLICRILELA